MTFDWGIPGWGSYALVATLGLSLLWVVLGPPRRALVWEAERLKADMEAELDGEPSWVEARFMALGTWTMAVYDVGVKGSAFRCGLVIAMVVSPVLGMVYSLQMSIVRGLMG